VCPGGVYCGEISHWTLIIFELMAPFIICLFLMPMIAKARVKDVYAFTRKDVFVKQAVKQAVPSKKKVDDCQGKQKKILVDEEKICFFGTMQSGMAYF